jgi:uncharacterized membrane protein (UPF0127 family)
MTGVHAAASGICRIHRVRVPGNCHLDPHKQQMSGVSVFMNFVSKVARTRARGRLLMSLVAALGLLGSLCISLPARAASVQPLEIATKSGVQVFSVEMATTEEEKTTGLMYRKELADGKGMLFDFSPEQQISMWMKNTYIPLDMIFIRADGRILRIAENTEPMSTKIISSGGLAKGVLEVIAGTAQKYGIRPGDRVAHPLFNSR